MPRIRKKDNEFERVTVPISSSTKKTIQKWADDEGYSFSEMAGALLERDAALEEIMESGGTVTVKHPDGSTEQLQSHSQSQKRRLKPF